MKKTIKYYEDAWFKVEYEEKEASIEFKAYKIEGLDPDNIEKSNIYSEDPQISGFIKWDGCMEFTQDDHYCGLYGAEQVLLLMKEIYKFAESLFGTTGE